MLKFSELENQVILKNRIEERFDELGKILGSGILDSNLVSDICMLFDNFISSHFTEAGIDLIFWWLYEDVEKKIYKGDDESINVEELEDLWSFMCDNKSVYFK